MSQELDYSEPRHVAFERYVVSLVAFVCAGIFVFFAIVGPLGLGILQHRTSVSGTYQLAGQDLADLLLMAPLLVIGGVLNLMRRDSAK